MNQLSLLEINTFIPLQEKTLPYVTRKEFDNAKRTYSVQNTSKESFAELQKMQNVIKTLEDKLEEVGKDLKTSPLACTIKILRSGRTHLPRPILFSQILRMLCKRNQTDDMKRRNSELGSVCSSIRRPCAHDSTGRSTSTNSPTGWATKPSWSPTPDNDDLEPAGARGGHRLGR